jgi:hypothetical protein
MKNVWLVQIGRPVEKVAVTAAVAVFLFATSIIAVDIFVQHCQNLSFLDNLNLPQIFFNTPVK